MKIKVQARNLQRGDITGSGEVVRSVGPARIPRGYGPYQSDKVEVELNALKNARTRVTVWGAYTEIGVERAV
jgi:hypothetical protein